MQTGFVKLVWVVVALWVGIVAARVWGPSDLYDKEQPRTTSYTVDMVVNGRWLLPGDTFGIPATKPPLFNWISVPFVEAFGFREWALKAPSILASAGVVGCLIFLGRRTFGGEGEGREGFGMEVGCVAALLWLASPVTVKLLYVARPDMLLTAFLTGAWVAATLMVKEPRVGAGVKVAFWLCTLGAALTKGPLAIFALVYLPLAALLIRRGAEGWRVLRQSGWWWGLPLLVAVMGAWLAGVYRANPEFVREVLLGREVANRIGGWKVVTTFFNGPAYVITRFLPWSLAAIGGVWLAARLEKGKRWLAHPLGPALLWGAMILAVFSLASTKRPDRYAPIYPAVAVMAAYPLAMLPRRLRVTAGCVAVAAALVAVGLCVQNQFFSEGAKTHYGENVLAFARDVKAVVGQDVVLFLDGEQTPLETLLGHVQDDPAPVALQEKALWVVRYLDAVGEARVVSGWIAQVDGGMPGDMQGRLGLYRLGPGEGVGAFAKAEGVEKKYAKGEIVREKAGERARWLQFWRVHTRETGDAHK